MESDGFGYIDIKEQEVERVLDLITGEQFFQLFSLQKKITDWAGDGDEDVGIDPDMERKDVKIDDEVGVAIVFEKEEDAEGYCQGTTQRQSPLS